MNVLLNLVVVLQILSALVMIGLVLIQHGKGADMGASFGSGASGSLFGATGSANFLSRSTAVCAAVFFVCTLSLAYTSNDRTPSRGGSILDRPASAGRRWLRAAPTSFRERRAASSPRRPDPYRAPRPLLRALARSPRSDGVSAAGGCPLRWLKSAWRSGATDPCAGLGLQCVVVRIQSCLVSPELGSPSLEWCSADVVKLVDTLS